LGIFQQNWDFYCILIFVTIRLKCNKILILVKKFSEPDFPSNQPISCFNVLYMMSLLIGLFYLFSSPHKVPKSWEWFDEELTEFWNTLRSVRFSDKFLQLPECIHFLVQHSILFIHKCYIDLKKIIFDKKIRRLHIIGIPGIGKIFFFYYLLHQLANKTVIYHKYSCLAKLLGFGGVTIIKSHRKSTLHLSLIKNPSKYRVSTFAIL